VRLRGGAGDETREERDRHENVAARAQTAGTRLCGIVKVS
jgi:hypothetical protein